MVGPRQQFEPEFLIERDVGIDVLDDHFDVVDLRNHAEYSLVSVVSILAGLTLKRFPAH
jgi:hypothetical protein